MLAKFDFQSPPIKSVDSGTFSQFIAAFLSLFCLKRLHFFCYISVCLHPGLHFDASAASHWFWWYSLASFEISDRFAFSFSNFSIKHQWIGTIFKSLVLKISRSEIWRNGLFINGTYPIGMADCIKAQCYSVSVNKHPTLLQYTINSKPKMHSSSSWITIKWKEIDWICQYHLVFVPLPSRSLEVIVYSYSLLCIKRSFCRQKL